MFCGTDDEWIQIPSKWWQETLHLGSIQDIFWTAIETGNYEQGQPWVLWGVGEEKGQSRD